jgi:hypothetical protein
MSAQRRECFRGEHDHEPRRRDVVEPDGPESEPIEGEQCTDDGPTSQPKAVHLFALASAAAASPTDAQRRKWARPARRGPASSVQAKVDAAILELLALGEFLEEEKASWLAGPSSSNGPAPVDDGTNSALVALIMRLAEAQDVALGWLSEQTVSLADGPAQSAWKAVVADALSAVHAARSEGTATVVEVGEVDGGDRGTIGAARTTTGEEPPPQRARRPAVSAVEEELRHISGLGRDAATQRRRHETAGLEGISDGRVVTAEPTLRVKATTVGWSMACLLANATAISGVAAALVGTVWWAVGEGADLETRYARAVCALAGLFAIGIFVTSAGMLLSATNNWSRGTAVRALSLAVPATLPLVVWAAYFQLGGAAQSASAYAVVSTITLSITATVLMCGLHIGSTIHAMPVNEASRNALAALHGIADFGGSSAAAPAERRWRKAAVGAASCSP